MSDDHHIDSSEEELTSMNSDKTGANISSSNVETESSDDVKSTVKRFTERGETTLSRIVVPIKNKLFRGSEFDKFDLGIEEDVGAESYGFHTNPIALKLDRIAYGLFGHLFRGNDRSYSDFDRALNQARIPLSYDIYLSRVMFYSISMAAVGAAIGILMAISFSGILINLESGIQLPSALALFIEEYKRTLAIVIVTGIIGVLSFFTTLGLLYYYPYYVAGERKREIDAMLPHALTFMYAMSRGGVNIVEVLRALAEAEDSYGEVSVEFRAIINNVDYVQEDLRTAILEEARETPSEGMQDFLEDLLNVVDTGADMEQFFLNKADVYLEKARTQQKQTLDTLELMSESYVTVFVASPIFILIILVVMSMMGGADIMMLYAMTYLGLPMGGIMFALIIKIISTGGAEGHAHLARERTANTWTNLDINTKKLKEDSRYNKYRRIKAQHSLKGRIFTPVKIMRVQPLYSLLLTFPLAGIWIAYVVNAGFAELSIEGFLGAPVWQTLMLFYIPVLITFGVFATLYELKARRENTILSRLPEAFKSASDANERGLTVEESFDIVAHNSGGALATELEQAVNQTTWTGNLNDSLVQFANSLEVARLSRTIKLITKANEVSGDVQSVLTVAARDVENMYKLDRERKQNAFTYIAIIIVSFLVSMGVIVMLDSSFLTPVAGNDAFQDGMSGGMSGVSGGGSEGGIPIEEFRMAFLHTCMALGGASGLVAGAMADNDPLAGIKYSVVTMGIAIVVFALV